MVGAVALALLPLALILTYVVLKGASIVGWGFLTKNLPIVTQFPGGGIGPAQYRRRSGRGLGRPRGRLDRRR